MNVRKLAALDLALHGPRLIVIEFALGVAIPLILGVLFLARGRVVWQIVFGSYLLALALNYVPLLIHVLLGSRERAVREAAAELRDGPAGYGLKSLLLLLPLVVPVLALVQRMQALRRPVANP